MELANPKVDNGGKYITATLEDQLLSDEIVKLEEDYEEDLESEYEPTSSEESEDEIIESYKKRKVAFTKKKKNGTDGIFALGINPVEFELVRTELSHNLTFCYLP